MEIPTPQLLILTLAIAFVVHRIIDFITLLEKIGQFSEVIKEHSNPSFYKIRKAAKKWNCSTRDIYMLFSILKFIEEEFPVFIMFVLLTMLTAVVITELIHNSTNSIMSNSISMGIAGLIISIFYALICLILENLKRRYKK